MKKVFVLVLVSIGVFLTMFLVKSSADVSLISRAADSTDKARRLPLGDGKISSAPKKGYIWSCQGRFMGGGAFRDGDWIFDDGTWDPSKKLEVQGDVAWDSYKYDIKLEGGKRKLVGNGLPNHHTGMFPVQRDDLAFNYDRNPNSINEYSIVFSLSANPTLAAQSSCVSLGAIGVMKSGVALFNGLDGQGKDAVAHEIQDKCNGHPERGGHYHYHNLSKCIEEVSDNRHSELVGYALDGFGIFGRFGENGREVTNEDLDECHGHTHEISWDGKSVVMYHYHATREYPYTIGCYKGTPIVSRREQPNNRPPFGGPPPPFGRP